MIRIVALLLALIGSAAAQNPEPFSTYFATRPTAQSFGSTDSTLVLQGGAVKRGSIFRPILTGTPIFYVSPAGSDSTGTGTLGNPWATCTHALFIIAQTYDFGFTTPTIQLANGTYNIGSGSGCFAEWPTVGGGTGNFGPGGVINILGNAGSPSSVIFDGGGTGNGGNGIFIAGPLTLNISGIQFQNLNVGLNMQSSSSVINIVGPVNFKTVNLIMDNEGGGIIFCNEGTPTTTITVSGANGQFYFGNAGALTDLNTCTVAFSGTPGFSFAIYNLSNSAIAYVHNNFTGTATGMQFHIDTGGQLTWSSSDETLQLFPTSFPGSVTGQNFGGTFNNNKTPSLTFANLPTTATPSGESAFTGYVANITDGLSSNCADGTCTTFGTTVSAGNGSLQLLVWWNGTHWTLVGK